jgi:hypothetical protein
MFFIFGSPRSGTTLLAQSLNAHSEITVPHETDFIIPVAFIFDRIKDERIGKELIATLITASSGFLMSIGEYVNADVIHSIVQSCRYDLGALLNSLYAEVAKATNAKTAGDKSPNDLLFLRILIKAGGLMPDMKILHIVRDVRDVMLSLNELNWVADLDLYFPRFWNTSNLYLHSLYKDKTSQYLLLRYEDLVADPELVLTIACQHLGVPFEPTMLSPGNRDSRYKEFPHHHRLFEPITTAGVGRYTTAFDRSKIVSYENQADEALRAFGYKLESGTEPTQPGI